MLNLLIKATYLEFNVFEIMEKVLFIAKIQVSMTRECQS